MGHNYRVRVIIDSNQIIQKDWFLSGAAFRELLRSSERSHIELIIPEIVFDEVVNKYREVLLSTQRDLKKVIRESNNLGIPLEFDSLNDAHIDQLSTDYESRLRRILDLYRVKIAPYPDVSHEIVARRALDRRKPFDIHGHKGYRDTLLWVSVLTAAAGSKVIFISGNSVDFAKSKQMPEELADDLLQDLAIAGHGVDQVILCPSVSDLVKSWTEHAIQLERSLQERLGADEEFRGELEALLAAAILERSDLKVDLDRMDLDEAIEGEVIETLPEKVYTFWILEIRSVREFAPDEYLLEIFAEADVDLAVTIRKDSSSRSTYLDRLETTSVTKTIDFEFDALYRQEDFMNIQMTYP
jgi:predicted nucleic acid-binding protein